MKTVVLFFALLFNQLNAQTTEGAEVREAQFAGGNEQCSTYFFQNLQYPETAAVRHVEGTVVVTFTIDTAGAVRNAKIRSSLGHGCDEEALRLVQSMPNWQPALLNGKPIASGKTLRVEFKMAR